MQNYVISAGSSSTCHARAHDPNTGKYPGLPLLGWRSLTKFYRLEAVFA